MNFFSRLKIDHIFETPVLKIPDDVAQFLCHDHHCEGTLRITAHIVGVSFPGVNEGSRALPQGAHRTEGTVADVSDLYLHVNAITLTIEASCRTRGGLSPDVTALSSFCESARNRPSSKESPPALPSLPALSTRLAGHSARAHTPPGPGFYLINKYIRVHTCARVPALSVYTSEAEYSGEYTPIACSQTRGYDMLGTQSPGRDKKGES